MMLVEIVWDISTVRLGGMTCSTLEQIGSAVASFDEFIGALCVENTNDNLEQTAW